jgi:DNA-binding PadR family transcriptional regulator
MSVMTCQEWRYDRLVSLRIAALGLLANEPGSGYDLLRHFEKSMASVWPATQSQLYGELNKLADAGLIEVSDIGPRGRKEYRITEAGRQELQRWVSNPQGDPPYRNASVLRVFLLGAIPSAQAREHMVAVAEHADADLKRYEDLRDSVDWDTGDEGLFYGRAALEYGLRLSAMEAEWARWVVDAIDARSSGKKGSQKVTH